LEFRIEKYSKWLPLSQSPKKVSFELETRNFG